MAAYLDCNATTAVDPRVAELVIRLMRDEFGNAGSRTHEYGIRAKQFVQRARTQVARLVRAAPDEVIFTSGATESNNLALLGLAPHAERTGRRHIISTAIEHKAVLEPLEQLEQRGFEIELLRPTIGGWVDPDHLRSSLRPDTLAVSIMHVNNETGVVQPVADYAAVLAEHSAYFHVDAAQGFGKVDGLASHRIDFISISGHKLYAPMGVGALIARRRGFERPPIAPLLFGGGQERGLRPGTVPVPLVAGLGLAAELAHAEHNARTAACLAFRHSVLEGLGPLMPEFNGDPARTAPHVLNVSFPGIDSEAAIVATKEWIAISNGSACTSHSYEPSHVLIAMGLPERRIAGALRLSWSHNTPTVDWPQVVHRLKGMSRPEMIERPLATELAR
jgi:cysteine desulfurase